jgi:hypothetical protein
MLFMAGWMLKKIQINQKTHYNFVTKAVLSAAFF